MSPHNRLRRIETSLPPIEAVLLWLAEMLELGQERYSEEMLADPRNLRVLLAKMIGDAIRENVIHAMKPEVLDQAVREAQKQGDMRMVLVLNLHEHVRGKLNVAHTDLLEERYTRILLQTSVVGHQPKSWDLWRAQLTDSLIEKLCLKKIVESISVKYYRGHALLFEADEDLLNAQIARLDDLMKDYNTLKVYLPDFKPIDLEALSLVIAEHAELQVENLVALARAKTLAMFGEEQAARELLDLTAHRAVQELKRLSSLSQR
jgi:hypothetical protein